METTTTTTPAKTSLWSRLLSGKLPSMDVNTSVSSDTILNIGAVIFLAGFLIVVSWYVLKTAK